MVVDQVVDLDRFEQEGYLVMRGALHFEQDIAPVMDEYDHLLDSLCNRWCQEGKLSRTFSHLPFPERLKEAFKETGQSYYRHFDISLPQKDITKETPIHLGPAIFNLITSPRLLDIVEQIVGSEIYVNPVHHVRIKIPERLVPQDHRNPLTAMTPYHQDQGVILPEADESTVLTVWLPITEATEENGCLVVQPGSHAGDLRDHCQGNFIPEPLLQREMLAPLPMQPGDVLLMHKRTIHGSLSNESNDIRWSFDLRYNPVGQPTGRPMFPGFVARSRTHPDRILTDHQEWGRMWRDTRSRLGAGQDPRFQRWDGSSPYCA